VAAIPVALTEHPENARDAFRALAFPYLNLPNYRKEVATAHPETLARFDERMATGDMAGALAALDEGFTDDYAGVGGQGAVRAKVEEYREAGVTLPAVSPIVKHEGSRGIDETLRAAAPA
jgi:hypothetical protein